MSLGQDLLDVPMGDMIRDMAFAIADAQLQLDTASVRAAEMMSGKIIVRDEDGQPLMGDDGKPQTIDSRVYFGKDDKGDPEQLSMMELGYSPNFYQFVDTIIEVKIAIKFTRETEYTRTSKSSNRTYENTKKQRKAGAWSFGFLFGGSGSKKSNSSQSKVKTSSVEATYSSKYSYSAEGSSLLRTKLKPVPPPAILQERIQNELEKNSEE